MRKLLLFLHSTLNGTVTGDPAQDKNDFMVWTTPGSVETGSAYLVKILEPVDTVLYGRATYESLGPAWSSIASWGPISDTVARLGKKINEAHKFVVSNTLSPEQLKWGAFEAPQRINGDIEAQIRQLKSCPGGDIVMFGSPTLVRSLADAGLIDEYHLQVHPVVVPAGEDLFQGLKNRKDFKIVGTEPLEDGSFVMVYEPA